MNWNIIEGKWKEMKGAVREQWGKLTDDEIDQIGGSREKFEGMLQQKYGMTQDAARKAIDEWAAAREAGTRS